MLTPAEQELRLECLRLAASLPYGCSPEFVVPTAEQFLAFTLGETAKSPRVRIVEAMNEAGVE